LRGKIGGVNLRSLRTGTTAEMAKEVKRGFALAESEKPD